jgi:hypothetical protein
MDVAAFRQVFQSFDDPETYSDTAINFWAGIGEGRLPADKWASDWTLGVMYFVAHHLAIRQRDQLAATPGEVKGPASSKSVDKVSISYENGLITVEGAGGWNLTSYGIELYRMARNVGAGCIQL